MDKKLNKITALFIKWVSFWVEDKTWNDEM